MAVTLIHKCFSSFLCLLPMDSLCAKHLVLLETKAPTPFNSGIPISMSCRSVRQQSRSFARLASIAETQPQLHLALLSLSATFPLLTGQLLLFRSTNGNKATKTRRSSEVCIEAIAHIFLCSICSRIY